MSYRPLHDRVVALATRAGRILVPDNAKEGPQEGEIVSAGQRPCAADRLAGAPRVKPGDSVSFGKWPGTGAMIGGKVAIIVKESDIPGVLA